MASSRQPKETDMADSTKPYGDVKYADPKNGKYPIDTEAHIRAAWSYINMPKNASAYPLNGVTLSEVKARIKAAMKGLGADVGDGDSSDSGSSDSGRSDGRPLERRFTKAVVGLVLLGGEETRDGQSPRRIGGYAAKFNTYSRDLGHFVEEVETYFFNKSKGDGWPDVICRFNHKDEQLLGTTESRTLALNTDPSGLLYDVEPPPSMRHVLEWVERGDVRKSSFAFRCLEDEWTTTPDGGPLRRLHTGRLVDVAPVVTPAYADTSAGLRSFADHFDAELEEVRSLAEAHELRRFFARTDRSSVQPAKPRLTGPQAMMKLMEKRFPPRA
jgi:uncharacterized protein